MRQVHKTEESKMLCLANKCKVKKTLCYDLLVPCLFLVESQIKCVLLFIYPVRHLYRENSEKIRSNITMKEEWHYEGHCCHLSVVYTQFVIYALFVRLVRQNKEGARYNLFYLNPNINSYNTNVGHASLVVYHVKYTHYVFVLMINSICGVNNLLWLLNVIVRYYNLSMNCN